MCVKKEICHFERSEKSALNYNSRAKADSSRLKAFGMTILAFQQVLDMLA
jgi:hypothetical protein